MRSSLRWLIVWLAALASAVWAQDGSTPPPAETSQAQDEARGGSAPGGSSAPGGAPDLGAPPPEADPAAQAALEAAIAAFEAADAALNEAYARAYEAMWPSAFERLRLAQRDWVVSRDVASEFYAELMAGPGLADLRATSHFYEYRTGVTEARTQFITGLAAYYEDPSAQAWEGLWVDGDGGHLAVRELEDGRLRFQLTVVRSPAFHTGWIEGVAPRNGDLAVYETTYESADGEEPVWVFFVRDGPYLRVRTANASYFAGARAYFDADYVRLRDLEPFDLD